KDGFPFSNVYDEPYKRCTIGFENGRHRYLLEIDDYQNHLYSIQFRKKNARPSLLAYCALERAEDPKDFNAMRAIGTCLHAMKRLVCNYDPLASFFFFAAPVLGVEHSITNTKRFRIYRRAALSVVGHDLFEHIWHEGTS